MWIVVGSSYESQADATIGLGSVERPLMDRNLTTRTIADFGEQWVNFTDNDGYYASVELFQDVLGPLLDPAALADVRVAEIGSGTGRIVQMLLGCGVSEVTAIEPSDAFEILRRNTVDQAHRIRYLKVRGDEIPAGQNFDFVFSIGVLHHIPEPVSVLRAAFNALRPGGTVVVWLYGYEGNERYLSVVRPVRHVTTKLPHFALSAVCHVLNVALDLYIAACRWIDLPLRQYALNVVGRFSRRARFLTIYDQLNPAYAKYYTRGEAEALLSTAGFVDVQLFHRHGYSWTVVGKTAS
jgi:SAM-dependent methyltransferase